MKLLEASLMYIQIHTNIGNFFDPNGFQNMYKLIDEDAIKKFKKIYFQTVR